MKSNILLIAMAVLASSCANLKNYDGSKSVNIVSEKTKLKIDVVSGKTDKKESAGILAAAASIGPSLIDLGVKSIQQKLKSDALKYTGTYKAFSSQEKFRSSKTDINLPKLTITRKIILDEDANATKDPQTASSFVLIPESSADQTAFRYKLDKSSFEYKYSIAKLKNNARYIDLTVEIKVKSLNVVSGEYKLNDIRTVSMNIPMVKVGAPDVDDDIYSGWIPLLPKSVVDQESRSEVADTVITTKSEGSNAPVTSSEIKLTKNVLKKEAKPINVNTGLYEIEVIVTELNPAKIKAEQRAAFVDSTSESGTSVLKSILEALTKEKKEDKEEEKKE